MSVNTLEHKEEQDPQGKPSVSGTVFFKSPLHQAKSLAEEIKGSDTLSSDSILNVTKIDSLPLET